MGVASRMVALSPIKACRVATGKLAGVVGIP
jgi:hypothetical protein